MKVRLIPVVLVALLMTLLVAAIFLQSDNNNSDEIIIDSSENFSVFGFTWDNQPAYRYEVYNKNGAVVINETVRSQPHIEYIFENTLLSIIRGVGTNAFLCQYYDIDRDLFSEIFHSPTVADHGNVVYMTISEGNLKLVVRDIFDESKFYKEFGLDFSPTAVPSNALINADYLDETSLTITYFSGENYEIKSTTLSLN